MNLISENNHIILPIVFGALYSNSKSHWNRQIHNLVFVALKIFMDLNPPFFEEVRESYKQQKLQERQRQSNREEAWSALRESVLERCGGDTSKMPSNFNQPIPPMDIGDTSTIDGDDDYSFMQQTANGQAGLMEGDEQMSMEGPSMDEGQMAAMGIGGQEQYGQQQQHMDEGQDDQHGDMHQFPGRPGGGVPQGGQRIDHTRRKSTVPMSQELLSQ